MRQITAVVLGAGSRGVDAYASYAERHPEEFAVVGVAEPRKDRRDAFVSRFGLDEKHVFTDWKDLLAQPKFADVVFVCTQDKMHVEPTLAAMERGYDILLEKPVATTKEDCLRLADAAKSFDGSVAVAHVLRYTPFFTTLKRLLDGGAVGKIRGIQHNENVGYYHYAHSFVRGNWRTKKEAAPMILAKSCHDMDILLYLTGADCTRLSSYGTRGTFTRDNQPAGAPDRCLDGCPHRDTCAYYAPSIYLTGKGFLNNVLSLDTSPAGITQALREGPYGRCVYACDNDMVEHQVVNMEMDSGVPVAFSMSAFTAEISRTMKIVGDRGELRGHMERNEIEVFDFATRTTHTVTIPAAAEGHGGGDDGIMREFLRHLNDRSIPLSSSLQSAVQSHLMALAAEEAKETGSMVTMDRWVKQ